MAADDSFSGFNDASASCFHTIDPASLVPQLLTSIAPFRDGNILLFSAANTDGCAGYPAMDENIMLRFKIVHHGRDNRLNQRVQKECLSNLVGFCEYLPFRKARELANGIHRSVEVMVPMQIAVPAPIMEQIQG